MRHDISLLCTVETNLTKQIWLLRRVAILNTNLVRWSQPVVFIFNVDSRCVEYAIRFDYTEWCWRDHLTEKTNIIENVHSH